MSVNYNWKIKYNMELFSAMINWLNINIGPEHIYWTWGCKDGTVFILDEKLAVAFALIWGYCQ